MHKEITRFYLDTNAIIHSRQYLNCVHNQVPEEYYTPNIKFGKAIIEALEMARAFSILLDIRTSRLAEFEMNKVYHRWIAVDILVNLGLPIHSLRDDGNILNHVRDHSKLKIQYDTELQDSLEWLTRWPFEDVVHISELDPQVFTIAMPMQSIAPTIQLMDSFHLAHAISLGAHYLVTSDMGFSKAAEKIIKKFGLNGILPTGQPFDPILAVMHPSGFKNKTKHLVTVDSHGDK